MALIVRSSRRRSWMLRRRRCRCCCCRCRCHRRHHHRRHHHHCVLRALESPSQVRVARSCSPTTPSQEATSRRRERAAASGQPDANVRASSPWTRRESGSGGPLQRRRGRVLAAKRSRKTLRLASTAPPLATSPLPSPRVGASLTSTAAARSSGFLVRATSRIPLSRARGQGEGNSDGVARGGGWTGDALGAAESELRRPRARSVHRVLSLLPPQSRTR